MRRIISLLTALIFILSLPGCSLFADKVMPLEGFGLGNLSHGRVEIPGPQGQLGTVELLEVEIDIPVTVSLPLPEVKDLTVSAASTANVECSVEEGVLTVTGRAYCQNEPVTVTLTAPKYEEGSYTFAVSVRLHRMTLEVLSPGDEGASGVNPDRGGATPFTLVEGESVTLPLAFQEGAEISVIDLSDASVAEALVEDGNLLVKALKAGSVQLLLEATHEPTYEPAQLELTVEVTPKPVPVAPPPAPPTTSLWTQVPNRTVDNSAYRDFINDIIYYTNLERADAGLHALTHLTAVDVPAALRAEEADELWDHTRPNGEMFTTIFAECGLKYPNMGENLYSVNMRPTARQVVDAWMASPKHRETLLLSEFVGIGVGVYQSGRYWYFCQLFV